MRILHFAQNLELGQRKLAAAPRGREGGPRTGSAAVVRWRRRGVAWAVWGGWGCGGRPRSVAGGRSPALAGGRTSAPDWSWLRAAARSQRRPPTAGAAAPET